jgi:two-component system, OmpR family, phosphate regulon response regulator PhoB
MEKIEQKHLYNKKILLVEDEDITLKIIKKQFQEEYNVKIFEAKSVSEAKNVIEDNKPDLIILDRNLTKLNDGMDVLKFVRSEPKYKDIGVIILTSNDNIEAIDQAYELQADEYIVKPFMPHSLKQRVMAVLRRVSPFLSNSIIISENLVFNVSQRNIMIHNFKVKVSKTDHKILILFCEKRGQIISREEIIAKVWSGKNNVSERTVDVHISRLRNTLREYGHLIATVSGAGYKMLLRKPEQKSANKRGRNKKLSKGKLHLAEAMLSQTNMSKQEIANALGISISTLYNHINDN